MGDAKGWEELGEITNISGGENEMKAQLCGTSELQEQEEALGALSAAGGSGLGVGHGHGAGI